MLAELGEGRHCGQRMLDSRNGYWRKQATFMQTATSQLMYPGSRTAMAMNLVNSPAGESRQVLLAKSRC